MNKDIGNWNGYFARHYLSKFNRADIKRAKNFIFGQFRILNGAFPIEKKDRILEIGCALGAFVELIKENGSLDVSAIELDEDAADYTRKTQEIEVFTSTINDFSADEKYSKIYAFEVLEHLNDPTGDLEKIYSLLEPGGYFIGSTPHPFTRSIVSDSSHIFVLHPLNWARLFERAGFEVRLLRPVTGLPFLYRYARWLSIYFSFPVPILPLVSTTLFVVQKKK